MAALYWAQLRRLPRHSDFNVVAADAIHVQPLRDYIEYTVLHGKASGDVTPPQQMLHLYVDIFDRGVPDSATHAWRRQKYGGDAP